MKILIASDSHDRWGLLRQAIDYATESGCEQILFAGDFMSPPGLECFKEFPGTVHMVWGNNDGEKMQLTRLIDANGRIILHGDTMQESFDGLIFYMNHYPDIVKNAAFTANYNVCIYGHDHIYHHEILDNGTLLLNPGEIQGYKTGESTCMLFDTQTKAVEKITLSQ